VWTEVAFRLEGPEVRMAPSRSPLEENYRARLALEPARSWKEVEAVAAEEQALEAAKEGLQ
jgi:hypothetical protein